MESPGPYDWKSKAEERQQARWQCEGLVPTLHALKMNGPSHAAAGSGSKQGSGSYTRPPRGTQYC